LEFGKEKSFKSNIAKKMLNFSTVGVWLRDTLAEREIPSTSLRAGSSLRLKNGFVQDDRWEWITAGS